MQVIVKTAAEKEKHLYNTKLMCHWHYTIYWTASRLSYKAICLFHSILSGKCSGKWEKGKLSEMWRLWNQLPVTTQYFYSI